MNPAPISAPMEPARPADSCNGTIRINGVSTANIALGGGDTAINRAAVVAAVNAIAGQTGVKAIDSGRAETGIDLVADDGRAIEIEFTDGDSTVTTFDHRVTGLATAQTYHGGFDLHATDGRAIEISQGIEDPIQANGASRMTTGARHSASAFLGTWDLAGGVDLSGGNAYTMQLSVSGGDPVTIVLSGNSPDAASFVDTLQTAIDEAIGAGIVTVGYQDDPADGTAQYLSLMANERIRISHVTALGLSNSVLDELKGRTLDGINFTPLPAFGGPDSLREGDLLINGVEIPSARAEDDTLSNTLAASSNRAASGIAMAAAINTLTERTGVTATAQATTVKGGSTLASTATDRAGTVGALYLNGELFEITLTDDADHDRATAMEAINARSGQTGVVATDTGGALKLTAADGRNISIVIDTNEQGNTTSVTNGGLGKSQAFSGADIGLDGSASNDGIPELDLTASLNGLDASGNATALDLTAPGYLEIAGFFAETTTSRLTLSSNSGFDIAAGRHGNVQLQELGFQAGRFGSTEAVGRSLEAIDISGIDGAVQALGAVDSALSTLNSQRGNLGALHSRLLSSISAMANTSNNLDNSRSRIQDADFAIETAALSRVRILQEVGNAMISQANVSTQNVLALLR